MGIISFFKKFMEDDELESEDEFSDEYDSLEEEEESSEDYSRDYGRDYVAEDNTNEDSEDEAEEKTRFEHVDVSKLDKNDIHGYIRNQCEIMENAAYEIELANEEYDSVTSYFSDIQIIETAQPEIKNEIEQQAEQIAELTVDRRIFKSGENRLSQSAFFRMERLEPNMPDALIEFQNNEAYYETVRKDMKMIQGEQMVLRAEAKELHKRQKSIQSMARMSAVGLFFVFGIFLVASIAMGEITDWLFSIVIGLSALIAIGLFWFLLDSQRKVKVIQTKLNRAAALLNKVKIKYINIASTVDYERSKYGVKNSYELSAQYELYLEVRKEQERVARMTEQLTDSEVKLESLLKQLKLYDPHIWLAQVKALIDPKEMVEVRHGLSTRRQKLRSKIKYNENRIMEAKANIKDIALSHPEYKNEVFEVIEQFENEVKA